MQRVCGTDYANGTYVSLMMDMDVVIVIVLLEPWRLSPC